MRWPRAYGSISYAGLLIYILQGLHPEDERVKLAVKWLSMNYTLEENPGMGQNGIYSYYHMMAKALRTAQITTLNLQDGTAVFWAEGLAKQLLSLQKSDGSWINDTAGRWKENDADLVTTYVILTLEHIYATF